MFSTVAAVVAILTYRRARATILQPIRNEVIKKQSEILVELLDFLPSEGKLIHEGLDYSSIAIINVHNHLRELGFLFANQDELFKKIDESVAGWTYVGESRTLLDVEVVGVFEDQKSEEIDIGKLKFENAKKGIVEIDKVYFTKNHNDFSGRLLEFSQNPYTPKEIQNILIKIINDIGVNLHVNMKAALVDFLREFCTQYFEDQKLPKINPIGVYNNFNHKRISHEQDIKRLRHAVREYLMIDKEWK